MGSESSGKPLEPAPSGKMGLNDIQPYKSGQLSLSDMAGGDKNYGLQGFGGKEESPYLTGMKLGDRYDMANDKEMGLTKLDSAYADQKEKTGKDNPLSKMSSMSFKFSPTTPEQYKDYGFSPQMSTGYGDPAQMMYKDMSYISQQAEEEDSLAQFLRWQREMGY